jgi:hypothetical protein
MLERQNGRVGAPRRPDAAVRRPYQNSVVGEQVGLTMNERSFIFPDLCHSLSKNLPTQIDVPKSLMPL